MEAARRGSSCRCRSVAQLSVNSSFCALHAESRAVRTTDIAKPKPAIKPSVRRRKDTSPILQNTPSFFQFELPKLELLQKLGLSSAGVGTSLRAHIHICKVSFASADANLTCELRLVRDGTSRSPRNRDGRQSSARAAAFFVCLFRCACGQRLMHS